MSESRFIASKPFARTDCLINHPATTLYNLLPLKLNIFCSVMGVHESFLNELLKLSSDFLSTKRINKLLKFRC